MTSAMRLPRRRAASAARGTGSLEAEDDIENRGEYRKRIPLQGVAAMPLDARIGAVPLARKAVRRFARLLDHERLKLEREPLFLAFEHEVLAQGTGSRLRSQLDIAAARRDGNALDRLQALRRRTAREPRAVAGGDPAAVDEEVKLAALEPERRQHVIAGDAAQHLVVEEERRARDEAAARADAPAIEGGGVQSHRRHRNHRALGRFVEAAAELEFFLGAPRLPAAERNRERDESRRRDA